MTETSFTTIPRVAVPVQTRRGRTSLKDKQAPTLKEAPVAQQRRVTVDINCASKRERRNMQKQRTKSWTTQRPVGEEGQHAHGTSQEGSRCSWRRTQLAASARHGRPTSRTRPMTRHGKNKWNCLIVCKSSAWRAAQPAMQHRRLAIRRGALLSRARKQRSCPRCASPRLKMTRLRLISFCLSSCLTGLILRSCARMGACVLACLGIYAC